jgi:ABC-type molybdate transport system substrate-binding protein
MKDAPHPQAAAKWLAFLQTEKAQAIYREFGFQPVSK